MFKNIFIVSFFIIFNSCSSSFIQSRHPQSLDKVITSYGQVTYSCDDDECTKKYKNIEFKRELQKLQTDLEILGTNINVDSLINKLKDPNLQETTPEEQNLLDKIIFTKSDTKGIIKIYSGNNSYIGIISVGLVYFYIYKIGQEYWTSRAVRLDSSSRLFRYDKASEICNKLYLETGKNFTIPTMDQWKNLNPIDLSRVRSTGKHVKKEGNDFITLDYKKDDNSLKFTKFDDHNDTLSPLGAVTCVYSP